MPRKHLIFYPSFSKYRKQHEIFLFMPPAIMAILLVGVDIEGFYLGMIALSLLLLISMIYLLIKRHFIRLINHPAHRRKRLDFVTGHAQARKRVPHRYVESHFRQASYKSTKNTHEMLGDLPPGHVIVANPASPQWFYWPQADNFSFDPIPLDNPSNDILRLKQRITSRSSVHKPHDEIIARKHADTQDNRLQNMLTFLIMLAAVIPSFIIMYKEFGHEPLRFLIIMTFLITFPLIGWFAHRRLRQEYWLVPGGMIVRQRRLWKKDRVFALRPTDSTLFIDFNQSPGMFVIHDQEVFTLPVSADDCSMPLLIAWLSVAPLPENYADLFDNPYVPEKRHDSVQLRQTPQISSVRPKT